MKIGLIQRKLLKRIKAGKKQKAYPNENGLEFKEKKRIKVKSKQASTEKSFSFLVE